MGYFYIDIYTHIHTHTKSSFLLLLLRDFSLHLGSQAGRRGLGVFLILEALGSEHLREKKMQVSSYLL